MTTINLARVEKWFNFFRVCEEGLEVVPSITELWEAGQEYLRTGNSAKARQCELLIRFLHNSSICVNLKLGSNVDFAYGGIGVVVHKDAEIGSNVMIGQGVTIGGAPGTSRFEAHTGKMVSYPKIDDYVYIAAGARIIGGIEVGSFSIVGANAVLKKTIPPFSVCFGVPVKEVKSIRPSEFKRYKGYWAATKSMKDDEYISFISKEYQLLVGGGAPSRANIPDEGRDISDVAAVRVALNDDRLVSTLMTATLESISQDFSKADNFEVSENGLVVRLPFTNATFSIPVKGQIDWKPKFDSNVATNTAFFYSLQWLGEWLSGYEKKRDSVYLSRAADALDSYLRYANAESNHYEILKIRSSDHSVSIRIRVLIKFLHLSRGQELVDSAFQRNVLLHLLALAEWVASPENFLESNHGLMCSIALLHIAVQFRHFNKLASRYEACAFDRILRLARCAFDKDGYCNENTIGYHRFNMSLYEYARSFCRTQDIGAELVLELSGIIEKAQHALKLAVWQDGSIPPIGDSPLYENVCTSINSSKWFSESGFLVVKNDDLYFSLICGSRGWVHKQCDDSSITLRYKNRSILIDAGHYTNDEKDPYRVALAGPRGHSGVFLERCDAVLREDFMKKFAPYEARITDFVEDSSGAKVSCFYTLQGGAYRIQREVQIYWPDEVLIRDHIISRDGDAVPVRQRFIFDPTATYKEGGKLVDSQDDEVLATLIHFSSSELDVFHAEPPPNARGWCSNKFGGLLPTSGVDFVQDGAAIKFVTAIKLADIDNVSQLSSQLRDALSDVAR